MLAVVSSEAFRIRREDGRGIRVMNVTGRGRRGKRVVRRRPDS